MFIVALDKIFSFRRLASSVGPTDLNDCSERETKSWEGALEDWDKTQHPPCMSLPTKLLDMSILLMSQTNSLSTIKMLILYGSIQNLAKE